MEFALSADYLKPYSSVAQACVGFLAVGRGVADAEVMAVAAFIRRRDRVTFLVVALGVVTALLAVPVGNATEPDHGGGANRLTLAWIDGNSRLRITGDGFRSRSAAEVRIGSQPWSAVRADAGGTITLEIPREVAAAGAPGSSVIVSGRGSAGNNRVLVSAVPPQAAARGPVDILPWSTGGVLVLALLVIAVRRLRRVARSIWRSLRSSVQTPPPRSRDSGARSARAGFVAFRRRLPSSLRSSVQTPPPRSR